MSEHTPGPWRVFKGGVSGRIIGIGELNGEGVCDCGFGVWRGGSEEAEANARLIAAAPELLEALQKARNALDLVDDDSEFHDVQSAREMADAAIAKATEET